MEAQRKQDTSGSRPRKSPSVVVMHKFRRRGIKLDVYLNLSITLTDALSFNLAERCSLFSSFNVPTR